MGVIKKLLKPRVIVWAASALVLTGVLIAANAVAVGQYGSLIDRVLGGKRASIYNIPIYCWCSISRKRNCGTI